MRRFVLGVLLAAVAASASACGKSEAAAAPAPALPPDSLAKLYPPQAEAPLWLLGMLDLGKVFVAMTNAVDAGDTAAAQAAFEDLSRRYRALGEKVPEWAHYIDEEALEALKAAIDAKPNPAQFRRDLGKFDDAACARCHTAERRNVWYVFDWPKHYADLTVSDPVTETDPPFRDFMFMMAFDLFTVSEQMEAGRTKEAKETAEHLKLRLSMLAGACFACHKEPRRHLLTKETIDTMDGAIADIDAGRAEAAGQKLDAVGQQTCYACHLVHAPAADVQRQWREAHPAKR